MESAAMSPGLGRLSERRGIRELARIEPPAIVNNVFRPFQTHKSSLSHVMDGDPILSTSNSTSSLASSVSKASISAPRLQSSSSSAATTPLDPLLCMNFENTPSLPMTPEIGEFQGNWRQLDSECVATYSGLGLDCDILEDLKRRTRSMSLSERVHVSVKSVSPSTSALFEQAELESPELQQEMRKTTATSTALALETGATLSKTTVQTSEELYDADTLSDPSAPTSPVPDTMGRLTRRTTALQRMLPQKLRASMRRRSSSAHSTHAAPPVPPISTMPTFYRQAPETPDEDFDAYFAEKLPLPDNDSFSSIEEALHSCVPTPPLPPFVMPDYFIRTVPTHSTKASATTSPVSHLPPLSENFPEISPAIVSEPVKCPLPQPPISPLGSPKLPPVRGAALNIITPVSLSEYQHQQVVPDVVDASSPAIISPRHRRQMSGDVPVTANSLADMIEQMIREDEAFQVTEKHLLESGWNTPQEVQAIRSQREETRAEWQKRIDESKRILMNLRKQEIQV